MNLKIVARDLRSRIEYRNSSISLKTDSGSSDYWENRYLKNDKPWDASKTPSELKNYLASIKKTGRVLIPGCGTAHEAHTFAEAGFDVYAIDFSPTVVKLAQITVGTKANIIFGDFFSFDFGELSFDVVYERAFLCALPRRLWTQYAKRQADLLRVGGQLVGYFIHDENEQSVPPFGLKQKELSTLLENQFTLIEKNKVQNSIPLFSGKEYWQIWKRIV